MKQILSRYKIASSSPQNLTKNPLFWLNSQTDFIFVLLLAILILIAFFRYTYSQGSTISNIFNFLIHCLGIWGVVVTAIAIATVEINRAIANETKEQGEDGLRKKRKVDLSKLEENYLPTNRTEPALAMTRLFRHVCNEAKNLRFESSINIVEPYRDESLDSLFTITNIQKIALRAGIFGTFIGLLEAIIQLSQIGSEVTPIEAIQNLSGALFISFSTTIAGLEVAMLLGFLLMILRKRQEKYFRDMESSVEVILLLARNADNDDQSRILGELAKVESVVEQLGKRFYENTQEIQRSISAVLERIGEQTNEIQKGMEQIKQTKVDFDRFIDEISEVQNNFIEEVKEIYSELSLKSFRDDIKNGIVFAGQTISSKLDETETSIQEQTEHIDAGINTLSETNAKFADFLQQLDSSQVNFMRNIESSQYKFTMLEANARLQTTINKAIQRMEKIIYMMKTVNKSLNKPLLQRIKNIFN
ncbi:MAG: MotA/TolQ/ExbB proton channel family protein [Trichodesmium sp. MAG_R01]|nr:MotA/TolQ/ExbB proton channel family protein [Trichodesmium sp. MAG_R01]